METPLRAQLIGSPLLKTIWKLTDSIPRLLNDIIVRIKTTDAEIKFTLLMSNPKTSHPKIKYANTLKEMSEKFRIAPQNSMVAILVGERSRISSVPYACSLEIVNIEFIFRGGIMDNRFYFLKKFEIQICGYK